MTGVGEAAAQRAHSFNAAHRLQGADEYGFPHPGGRGDDVQHGVQAIGEVHIRAPRRAEHGAAARGFAPERMAGGVVMQVRFRFHNNAAETLARRQMSHNPAAEQCAGHVSRVLQIELLGQGPPVWAVCYHGEGRSSSAGASSMGITGTVPGATSAPGIGSASVSDRTAVCPASVFNRS